MEKYNKEEILAVFKKAKDVLKSRHLAEIAIKEETHPATIEKYVNGKVKCWALAKSISIEITALFKKLAEDIN